MSMLNRYFLIGLVFYMSISMPAFAAKSKNAEPIFGPPTYRTLQITAPNQLINHGSKSADTSKTIALINFRFTDKQKKNFLATRFNQDTSHHTKNKNTASNTVLPSKVDLGMNKVPVLDQGMNGACSTFATVAALDALLNQGELVSPLCVLQLGNYLSNRGFGPNGWDGSLAPIVLARFQEYGIVSMTAQRTNSCGGLNEYPNSGASNAEMTVDDYHQNSINISNNVYWYTLLTYLQSFFIEPEDREQLLYKTKKLLAESNDSNSVRIVLGVHLPSFCDWNVGACGTYHAHDDSWVITKAMIKQATQDPDAFFSGLGGHAMVMTGYDDNAVVKDNEGATHRGVFILRNSWGNKAGDQGNFYMSYDFFENLAYAVSIVNYSKNPT